MEKATMLSSLKWGSSVFTIIQVILWSVKVSSSFYFSIKPMIETITLQFTYMYARHACHTPVQWQLLCSPGHWNWIIQFKFICPSAVFQNSFNFSILIPILSCSPDSLLMISMVPHFVAFYFMITELTGVGYSWRSLLSWLHCCPSCLIWKLWGTVLAPNTRSLVNISSQSGCLPLFSTVIGKFAHWSCMCTLYNRCTLYSQWEYASYHTLQYEVQYEVHWSLKCFSLFSRFFLLKRGSFQYVHFITCIMSRDHITLSWMWFQDYYIFCLWSVTFVFALTLYNCSIDFEFVSMTLMSLQHVRFLTSTLCLTLFDFHPVMCHV